MQREDRGYRREKRAGATVETLPLWLGISSEVRLRPEEPAMNRSSFRTP